MPRHRGWTSLVQGRRIDRREQWCSTLYSVVDFDTGEWFPAKNAGHAVASSVVRNKTYRSYTRFNGVFHIPGKVFIMLDT